MSDWQPIETAPKDRVIDLWSSRGFRYCDAIWDVVEYGRVGESDVYGWTDKNHHGSIMDGGPFTHWMPLPPAPRAEGGEE